MKSIIAPVAALCVGWASQSTAGLIGTDLTLSGLNQLTSTSQAFTSSFPRVARVTEGIVEFPDVASLFNPNDPKPPGWGALVNTSIDAGDDYIQIDFENAGSGVFASGFENTYVFTFDSAALATLVGASIDRSVTTLALSDSDLRFGGNQLFVNVESLRFNTASFVRIDLDVVGGPTTPVSAPGSTALLAISLLPLGLLRHRRRGSSDENEVSGTHRKIECLRLRLPYRLPGRTSPRSMM